MNKKRLAVVFFIISAAVTILKAVPRFVELSRRSADNTGLVSSNEFLFDTYCTVETYCNSEAANRVNSRFMDFLRNQDEIFRLAYDHSANELSKLGDVSPLSRCLSETSALNNICGGKVNLTCGALTRLWGVSGDNPLVPSECEIEEALSHMEDTDYHGGNLSAFGKDIWLDFGAVAKGYAAETVLRTYSPSFDSLPGLKEGDDFYTVVNLGSTVAFYGKKPGNEMFRTAIKDPFSPGNYMGFVETNAAYISTSGGYERYFEKDGIKYSHILDTETGKPCETDLASVTVIVPMDGALSGGLFSDFLSTYIYMEGTEDLDKYLGSNEFYIVAVDENKEIYLSGNMPRGMFVEN